ncbi:MAG TPA: hypothetical protein VEV16_04120 [Daejeonella sp.]|nr:hypothetical protein [Daejeonella sp.]
MSTPQNTYTNKLIEKFDTQLRDILVADIKAVKHNSHKVLSQNFAAFIRQVL